MTRLNSDYSVTLDRDPIVVDRGETVQWTADPESPIPVARWIEGSSGGSCFGTPCVDDGRRVYLLDAEVEVGPGE